MFMPTRTPRTAAASAASTIASASAPLAATGFSSSTCLPASSAASTSARCEAGGVPTYTMSQAVSAEASSDAPVATGSPSQLDTVAWYLLSPTTLAPDWTLPTSAASALAASKSTSMIDETTVLVDGPKWCSANSRPIEPAPTTQTRRGGAAEAVEIAAASVAAAARVRFMPLLPRAHAMEPSSASKTRRKGGI